MMSLLTAVLHIPNSREDGWRGRFSDIRVSSQSYFDIGSRDLIQADAISDLGDIERASVLIMVPSPEDAIATAMMRFKMSILEAVRFASVKFAQAAECVALGGQVASTDATSLDALGDADVQFDRSISRISISQDVTASLDYFKPFPPRIGAEAKIHPSLFLTRTKDQDSVPAIFHVDMTGRRRILLFGPYLELPPGLWQAKIRFLLEKTDAVVSLRFEWASGEDCVRLERSLQDDGVYDVSLERTWSSAGPCELRVWLDRSVFDAQLIIEAIHFRKIS